MAKGISPLVTALIVVLGIISSALIGYQLILAIKPPVAPVEYKGELEEVYLPTEGFFASELTEHVACNVTDDVLGKDYASCIFRTDVTLNATENPYIVGKEKELSLALEVDGAIKSEIEAALEAAVAPELYLTKFEIWTHEDKPSKIASLAVEDQKEVDTTFILPEAGEFVFYVMVKPKSGIDLVAGDDVMKIDLDLRDTAAGVDVDEGHALIESG